MKYLTKEWYQLCQNCHYHLSLQVRPQAAQFSQSYYQSLYGGKLGAHMKLMGEVARLSGESFQAEREKAQFRRDHQRNTEHLRQVLPREILDQVADVRVLALDVSTREVKDALTRWCEDNQRQVDQVLQKYTNFRRQTAPQVGAGLQEEFSFHDSTVKRVERGPDRLTLYLEDGGYSPVSRVDYLSPRILEEDEGLEGAVWLYEEIHPAQGGNEYHTLLWREHDQLLYLTVFAKGLRMYEE